MSAKPKSKPEENAASNPMTLLVDEVIRLGTRLRTVFAGSTEAAGLSTMEATVLSAVVEAKTSPTVPQIGRSLGHPRQVIQRAANELAAKGLIEGRVNPDHKRAPLLVATPAGAKRKRLADAHAIEAADALLGAVDFAKCEQLTRELRDLRHAIEAHIRTRSE